MQDSAIRQSAEVASIIAEMFKPTLGPNGFLKVVENKDGLWLSKDAAVIFDKLESEHPVAKILSEASASIAKGVGDGTCTFLILVGELLSRAKQMIDAKVHPNLIVDGWRIALDYCLDNLNGVKIDRRDELRLLQATRSMLSPEIGEQAANHLSSLATEVVLHLPPGGDLDLSNIAVEKEEGGSIFDSFLVRGVALRHELGDPSGPRLVKNARIAIVKGEIIDRTLPKWRYETRIELTTPSQVERMKHARDSMLLKLMDRIVRSGANVLFIEKGVDPFIMSRFTTNAIMVVRRVVVEGLERIAKATGGKVISNLEDLTDRDLGSAGLVRSTRLHNQEWVFIDGCREPAAMTLMLRGPTDTGVFSIARSVERAMKVAKEALRTQLFVLGGGAFEMSLACKLRNVAYHHSGRQQMAMNSFAEALEAIPMTLAKNAGMDVMAALADLKAGYTTGMTTVGIDSKKRKLADMDEIGVLDTLSVKRRVLTTAFGIASMLVRVDAYIYRQQAKTKAERIKKEREKYTDPERVKKIQREQGVD